MGCAPDPEAISLGMPFVCCAVAIGVGDTCVGVVSCCSLPVGASMSFLSGIGSDVGCFVVCCDGSLVVTLVSSFLGDGGGV